MAASSSFLLSSFSPKTLTSKPQPLSSFLPISFSSCFPTAASATRNVSFDLWSSFASLRNSPSLGSGFVPKVTLSSEVEQEEDVEELSEGEAAAEFSPDLKLFVGNLPFSVDSAQLAELFQRVGNVEMVEVIYDKLTGRSRGFGFVTMSSIEEAEAAAEQFNGYTLDGRMLRVNSGPPPRREEAPSRGYRSGGGVSRGEAANRVYVGNLSWGVDNLALETLFSEQGKVLEAKVVYDRESGRSRGFGFVTYSSAEEADNAIASLNGADLDGRSIRVTVADPRPRRQF